MSTTFKGSLTHQLKLLDKVGDSFIIELNQGVTFNKAMKATTATCAKLGIKVRQQALRAVDTNIAFNEIINTIKVTRSA